jgi:hypothetical protein
VDSRSRGHTAPRLAEGHEAACLRLVGAGTAALAILVGVSVLLLVFAGVIYGITTDLLRVGPAIVFLVALGFLVARIGYSSNDLMGASLGGRMLEVLFRLAASYIPAYLMFALVTDLPRNQDLNHIRPFLASQTAALAGGGQAVLAELKKAAGYESADPPTKEDFEEICKRINPLGPASLARRTWPITRATWIEFLFDQRQRSARAIETLFRYLMYLDPEHKRLIRQIENNSLYAQLDELRAFSSPASPSTIQIWASLRSPCSATIGSPVNCSSMPIGISQGWHGRSRETDRLVRALGLSRNPVSSPCGGTISG